LIPRTVSASWVVRSAAGGFHGDGAALVLKAAQKLSSAITITGN
jgi:hypothetical protein